MHAILSRSIKRCCGFVFALAVVASVLAGGLPVWAQDSDDALFIDARGQVGIGNRHPQAALDVAGAIRGVGMVPPGGIIMFSGDVATAFDVVGNGRKGTRFEGWQLCNGKNGAPDLQDRFIVAAGQNYKIGDKGGSDTVTLTAPQMPVHRHTAQTVASGIHIHNIQRAHAGALRYTWKNGDSTTTVKAGAGGKHYNQAASLTTDGKGQHTHPINIADTGGNQPHENRPSYYAVAFIMRLPVMKGEKK